MKNIVWKLPNGKVAITYLIPPEVSLSPLPNVDASTEAQRLVSKGVVPADWELVTVDQQDIPSDRASRENWVIEDGKVVKEPKNPVVDALDL